MSKPSIILLEGADGAGKTTLADHLAELDQLDGHMVSIIHNGPPTPGRRSLFNLYMTQLKAAVFLRDVNGVTTIIDRSYLSEVIYGPIYRGKSAISPRQRRKLERFAVRNSIALVSVEADLATRLERINARGEEIDQHVGPIGYAYTKYFQSHKHWITVSSLLTNRTK